MAKSPKTHRIPSRSGAGSRRPPGWFGLLWGASAYLGGMTQQNLTRDGSRALEPLLSITELADYLGLPVSTLYDWRTHGKGPIAYRLGKHLK